MRLYLEITRITCFARLNVHLFKTVDWVGIVKNSQNKAEVNSLGNHLTQRKVKNGSKNISGYKTKGLI